MRVLFGSWDEVKCIFLKYIVKVEINSLGHNFKVQLWNKIKS
jgi:hypothetical protein